MILTTSNDDTNVVENINDNRSTTIMSINSAKQNVAHPIIYPQGQQLHIGPTGENIFHWNDWKLGPLPLETVVLLETAEKYMENTGHLFAKSGRGFKAAHRSRGFAQTSSVELVSVAGKPPEFYDDLMNKMEIVTPINIYVKDDFSAVNLLIGAAKLIVGEGIDKDLIQYDGLQYAAMLAMKDGAHVFIFSAGTNTAYVGGTVGVGGSRGIAGPDAATGFTIGGSISETIAKGYPVVSGAAYRFKDEYLAEYVGNYTTKKDYSFRKEILQGIALEEAEDAQLQRADQQRIMDYQERLLKLEIRNKELEIQLKSRSLSMEDTEGGSENTEERVVKLGNAGVLRQQDTLIGTIVP